MPSPGVEAIRAILGAKSYVVEGGFPVQFNEHHSDGTVQRAAQALDAGWTSASPTTPTTMGAAFQAAFAGYAGAGLAYITCVAGGIDAEIAEWVASWDSQAQAHAYAVNAASMVNRIMLCSPVQSNGARAFAEVIADAFMSGFQQEGG